MNLTLVTCDADFDKYNKEINIIQLNKEER
jgi:hypothetical protein